MKSVSALFSILSLFVSTTETLSSMVVQRPAQSARLGELSAPAYPIFAGNQACRYTGVELNL